MNNDNFYSYDFNPDYVYLNEKIQAIAKQSEFFQLRNVRQPSYQIYALAQQIDSSDLKFYPQRIYSSYASKKQLRKSSKQKRPRLCSVCEQKIQKQLSCQFCAEIFCRNCCWRKRVIPFLEEKNQPKSCCEICHKKFVKLIANQEFYAESQLHTKIINYMKGKYEKQIDKKIKLNNQLDELQNLKSNQTLKEMNLLLEIETMEKQIERVSEQLEEEKRSQLMRKQKEIQNKKRQQSKIQKDQLIQKKESERNKPLAINFRDLSINEVLSYPIQTNPSQNVRNLRESQQSATSKTVSTKDEIIKPNQSISYKKQSEAKVINNSKCSCSIM